MDDTLKGLCAFLKITGGLGILVLYALFPVLILYLVYQAMKAGRGYWSAGTNKRRHEDPLDYSDRLKEQQKLEELADRIQREYDSRQKLPLKVIVSARRSRYSRSRSF